jgi:hypothetical protein
MTEENMPTEKDSRDNRDAATPGTTRLGILRTLCGDSYFLVGVAFALFLLIWLSLLCTGRSAMLQDPGSFWHVVAGDRMLATRGVPREDPYSFTFTGRPWVADQWLAECCMAAVHRVAGWDGLLLLTASLLTALYTWLGIRLLRSGLHLLPAGLLLALALRAGSIQFHVRPLVVSIGLLAVTFAWLVDIEAGRKSPRQLVWLIPLMILWANLHGGVIAGLGTVGFCLSGWCVVWALQFLPSPAGGRGARGEGTSPREIGLPGVPTTPSDCFLLVVLLAVLAATTLVNPYGIELPRAWLTTLSMRLPNILQEHGRLGFGEPLGWATVLSAVVYLVVLVGVFPRRPRVTWLVPLIWFVLSLQRVRNVPLFAVVAVIGLADMLPFSHVGRWLERRDLLAASRPAVGWRAALLPLILVLVAAAFQATGLRVPVVGRGWARFDPAVCPTGVLPKLLTIDRASKDGTRIFNDLNFGGFLIYFAPHLRVFVDDRCSLYGGPFLEAYEHARRDDPAQIDHWRGLYGFPYALVETDGRFDRHLAAEAGWVRLARTPAATLYEQHMGDPHTMQ